MEALVAAFIEQHHLLEARARVLVGVSGGVDSVALLHLLRRLGYAVEAAHVNYGLREEADADEAHVRSVCEAGQVPLRTARMEARTRAAADRTSVQEAARDLRYGFFAQVAAESGIADVAVAHHLDDQAETLLLNLFRGAGLEGLAGMAPQRPLDEARGIRLVRPLLGTRRMALEAYARAEGLMWREDASNVSSEYRRNALRREILPRIETHFGTSAPERIAHAAGLVRAYLDETVRAELAVYFDRCAQPAPEGGGRLDLGGLRRLPDVWQDRLLLEALRRWLPQAPREARFAAEVRRLAATQTGRRVETGTGTIWRERGALVFLPEEEDNAGEADVRPRTLDVGEALVLPQGRLTIRPVARPAHVERTPYTVFADADRLCFPLTVRPWQPGDRFRPLGLGGSKKVSDVLTDAKVPSHRRSDVLVLLSGGEIVWLIGHRPAEGLRLEPATQRVVKITFEPPMNVAKRAR